MLSRTELETLEKFEHSARTHINCIRYDSKSKTEHRRLVHALCDEAYNTDHNFLTRARLQTFTDRPFDTDRLVADFVDLKTGEVVEVAVSEGKASLDRKRIIYEKYGLRMVVIDAKEKKKAQSTGENN